MARALFPEEESAIDYKVVELDAFQRRRLDRNFLAAVLVFLLLLVLCCSFVVARSVGNSERSTHHVDTVTVANTIVQVEATTKKHYQAGYDSIARWQSYLWFEESAPREPMFPGQNVRSSAHTLRSHANASLYVEIHPKQFCLLVLSRKALTENELENFSEIKDCYGRLERNFRATEELSQIDVVFLRDLCGDMPLVPVMQKCGPES